MNPRNDYYSSLHALSIVVQAMEGVEYAITMVEALWEEVPPSGVRYLDMLLALLGPLPCHLSPYANRSRKELRVVLALIEPGDIVFMSMRLHEGESGRRWAVCTRVEGSSFTAAMLAQPGDYIAPGTTSAEMFSGDIMVVRTGLREIPPIAIKSWEDIGVEPISN